MKKTCIGLLGISGNYRKLNLKETHKALLFALKNFELVDISTDYGLDFKLINLIKDIDLTNIDSKLIYKVGCNCSDGYKAEDLVFETHQDLNKIGLNKIQSILFHRPSIGKLESDIKYFNSISRRYKNIRFGLCTNSPNIYKKYKENIRIEVVQLALNPLDYFANKEFMAILKKDKVSIQARSILSSGLLTGKYNQKSIFKDLLRSKFNLYKNKRKYLKRINVSLEIIDHLKEKYNISKKDVPIFLYSLFEDLEEINYVVRGGSSIRQLAMNKESIKIEKKHKDEFLELMQTKWACEYV